MTLFTRLVAAWIIRVMCLSAVLSPAAALTTNITHATSNITITTSNNITQSAVLQNDTHIMNRVASAFPPGQVYYDGTRFVYPDDPIYAIPPTLKKLANSTIPTTPTGKVNNTQANPLAKPASPSAKTASSTTPSKPDAKGTTPSKERRQGGMRVMIVGDSISQGQHGDYTWRYRIAQWFQQNNVAVDFVGPYTGTVEAPAMNQGPPQAPRLASMGPDPGSPATYDGPYASGVSFDSNHWSAWGRAMATDKDEIYGVLQGNPADMLLVELGFNDLGWWASYNAQGLLNNMATFISEARRANPNMKFAIANVPQRSFIGGRQDLVDQTVYYNSLLAISIPNWSTPQSPISLVRLQETYDCAPLSCPAGYDGLHPNELGEYMIASSFASTLHDDFKLGNGYLAIPGSAPQRYMQTVAPSNLRISSSPQGATATWDPIFGAYTYDVQVTITGADGSILPINYSPSNVQTNRWDSRWALDGWTYTIQVRARSGDTRVGPWSGAVSAVAHPQLPGAPQNVIAHPTATGVDISWSPPTGAFAGGITEYNVIYYDIDSCNFLGGYAVTGTSAHIDGLVPGHHIFLAVNAWTAQGPGWPQVLTEVEAGGGTPATPGAPTVNVFNPTSVQLNWNEVAGAAGYWIWMRNVNDPKSVSAKLNNTVPVACDNLYFLFPGAWNYEFCVSAFNGAYESGKSACTVGPVNWNTNAEPTCPAGPTWCSGGGSGGYAGMPPAGSTGGYDPAESGSAGVSGGTAGGISHSTGGTGVGGGGNGDGPGYVSGDPREQEAYSNEPWYKYDCNDPSIHDAGYDPTYRWNAVDTDGGWITVNGAWEASNMNITYSPFVASFFHLNTDEDCGVAADPNGCSQGPQCNNPTKPAGYNIFTSFVNYNNALLDIENSIYFLSGQTALLGSTFSSTFGTYNDESEKILNLVLDVVGLGLGAALAPVWAYILKGGTWGKANKEDADVIKDEVNNIVGSNLRFGNLAKGSGSQQATTDTLEKAAATILTGWAAQMTAYHTYIFGGTDQAINDLLHIIDGGVMLDSGSSVKNSFVLQQSLLQIIWAKLLPLAWNLNSNHNFAVVLDSGAACGTQNPLHGYADNTVAAANFACVNNRIYYLLGGNSNAPQSCSATPKSGPTCVRNYFTALPGASQLSANNNAWSGLTVQNLITGAVNTFNANGGNNSAPGASFSNQNTISAVYDAGVQAAGIVQIPVCSPAEAWTNWFKGTNPSARTANYPCN